VNNDIQLSVVIPSFKDPYLQKTIDSLINNSELGDKLEIIPVLDGYWPEIPLKDDDRVRVLHLGTNVGMRSAINAGVRISRGKFIMRTDEHCDFEKGFDKEMIETCPPNGIITGVRYYLDPVNWVRMDKEPVIYEKLAVQTIEDTKKFCGFPWPERDIERKDIPIDETMAMQGSVWVMPREWWNKIGELDNKYGSHYQDQHEMIFKTWKLGGKMMINKNKWYAHRHHKFPRTHQVSHGRMKQYSQIFYDEWQDYYREIKKAWNI
jgi:glycosyltransferase involved in cell wall biosynthesis